MCTYSFFPGWIRNSFSFLCKPLERRGCGMRGAAHVTAGERAFWRIHRRHPPAPEREKTAEASTRKIRGGGGITGPCSPRVLSSIARIVFLPGFCRFAGYFRF